MNTSFEIIEPKVFDVTKKRHGRQSFSSNALRHMPLAAASLSVVISVASMNCINTQRRYHPVFDIESIQSDLSVALGNDFEAQAKLLKKLNALKSSLQYNWNGEYDSPIEESSFTNAKIAISATPGAMLKQWRLFPNPNGTLLLSPKDKSIAGISIGNDEFSYAAYVSDDNQISGKEPFSIDAFKSALNQIHRILGYV